MSDQFVAEIRIFGGNFAPLGWAFCNGQLLPIAQNTALFSLLGTNFGGNGTSTFGLPNLQGAAPLGMGQGPGLTNRAIGQTGGEPTVTLLSTQTPAHNHNAQAAATGGTDSPTGTVWGEAREGKTPVHLYAPSNAGTNVAMNASVLSPVGGGQPHNNLQPYLVLTFIIAQQGIYPSRS